MIFQSDPEDDVTQEETWRKSNPSLGVITTIEDLRADYQKAINSASTRTYYQFITRRVNVPIEEPTNWLDPQLLDKCFVDLNIEDYKGRDAYIGVDLSVTSDLSSIGVVFPNEDERTCDVFSFFFMAFNPSKLMRKGNFDLQPHIDGGFVHQSDKEIVDYKAMVTLLKDLEINHNIVKLLYDPYNAPYFISDVRENTMIWCEKYAQTPLKFNVPLHFIQDAVATSTIRFATNPVLRWNFSNVVIRQMDSNDNLKIDKRKRKDAVDGVVAFTQCVGAWLEDIYEEQ